MTPSPGRVAARDNALRPNLSGPVTFLFTRKASPVTRYTTLVASALAALTLLAASCAPEPLYLAQPVEDSTPVAQAGVDAAPIRKVRPTDPVIVPSSTPSFPTIDLQPAPKKQPQPATPKPTPEGPPALIEVGAEGDEVRELQHRLLQLQWFEGEITPVYGEKTRLAVAGFQTKRGLPELGYVDQSTWDRLVDMTHEPTHDEMHNIMKPGPPILALGSVGPEVRELEARLRQIAWLHGDVDDSYDAQTRSAVEGFQAKREIPITGEVDQRTLERLHAMTSKPTQDELDNVEPAPVAEKGMTLDDRCLQGRVVCISKAQRKLAWVIDGQIQMSMDVRFGSELTPTRNGVFSVNWKSRDHHSSLYDTPMPYALFFSGGQAVHYSADFAARGWNGASYGCVNVRDKEAVKALFEATKTGDKVVVYTD